MRVVNIVTVKEGVVDEIESFGVFEEQLSEDVVEKAEEAFVKKLLELSGAHSKEDFEDDFNDVDYYLEDGSFSTANTSVSISWSDI